MLITSRTYSASQIPDSGMVLSSGNRRHKFKSFSGWHADPTSTEQGAQMLLIHQAGRVRVGEVARYTLTYTPTADTILPPPEKLFVRVKNTSATPLRAAYLHGPYTLYTACYPSTFDPNAKYAGSDTEGIPQFEPYLKAGGNWDAVIAVPGHLCQTSQQPTLSVQRQEDHDRSVTWIIEIVSQVVFSSSAAVHFELIVGRDEKSIDLCSSSGVSVNGLPSPPQLHEHWASRRKGEKAIATKGVYSKSIVLTVDDTASLWNSPPFPSFQKKEEMDDGKSHCVTENVKASAMDPAGLDSMAIPGKKIRKKRVHLVVLTHGLLSNLGADMLYLKESIDMAARKARKVREQAKKDRIRGNQKAGINCSSTSCASDDNNYDNDDDEQVIVRGFPGNAVRTERGIQYLGKRLAKYILLMTYPDQPYLPLKSGKRHFSQSLSRRKAQTGSTTTGSLPASETHENLLEDEGHAYRITSISFIGHSLGGLVQTYAIAYIQKHSPQFFELIRPVNFIALATPFLGLSNENPLYIRFALDFGLVGRSGQDLGLSWIAPKMRSGWGALIGGKGGESQNKNGHSDPGSKPLLRVLPNGPARDVLLKFRHRTIYSNVVNDGIVPLRTSCLFFLDWKGLDRVEKASRGNGLVGTMAEWGWAELTGANSKVPRTGRPTLEEGFEDTCDKGEHAKKGSLPGGIPLRPKRSVEDVSSGAKPLAPAPGHSPGDPQQSDCRALTLEPSLKENSSPSPSIGPLDNFLSIFRQKEDRNLRNKQAKIFKRSQTLNTLGDPAGTFRSDRSHCSVMPSDNSVYDDDGLNAPPRTTFFESAGDLLMPPLPPAEFIADPSSRPRTIFHDRVYHPEDIPPPLPSKRRAFTLGSSHSKGVNVSPASPSNLSQTSNHSWDDPESGLRVEEKIARAYHRDLSWRKVLVRLEPDAHNNIIVRRMFPNAYGWPVVKHLVDTHFGYTAMAELDDILEESVEKARPPNIGATSSGDEVEGQTSPP